VPHCFFFAVDVGLWASRLLLPITARCSTATGAAAAEDFRGMEPPAAAATGPAGSVQVRALDKELTAHFGCGLRKGSQLGVNDQTHRANFPWLAFRMIRLGLGFAMERPKSEQDYCNCLARGMHPGEAFSLSRFISFETNRSASKLSLSTFLSCLSTAERTRDYPFAFELLRYLFQGVEASLCLPVGLVLLILQASYSHG
jgi:hypothetical protein